ncbi:HisA/HisF-related TIM barrel protein [Methylobacter sp. YRD-M1]|uniref:HisA/HisF-related TIM barrel protein n=1 Tax=Methylobacter sp. YRD-M1 TaxID=2911520 RepID=UPI00227D4D40|nr:HisA/HisF-related TIM barrel protein [Methylobacter sp. YRD-M1]WAK03965.1 HisA/HisF-related TIM barrel protein [Methylobacter sp. YRD-M1]
MKIIPVIDLKDGVVVHARQGKRDQYQPINTRLCSTSDIDSVIEAFLNLHDFSTFYIADLNAITHQGNHEQLIDEVLARFPELTFWVDSGYQSGSQQRGRPGNYMPVLGSESFHEETIGEIEAFDNNFILSLDYSSSSALGAKSLFSTPDLWPDHIIIMTLARVGSHSGPDLDKLAGFCRQHPDKNFIAAGGIRNKQDLADLSEIGVKQALVASALHSGHLSADDIKNLQAKKYPDESGYF